MTKDIVHVLFMHYQRAYFMQQIPPIIMIIFICSVQNPWNLINCTQSQVVVSMVVDGGTSMYSHLRLKAMGAI